MSKLRGVRHKGEYRLEVVFEDGLQGEVDFSEQLWGSAFEPLHEVSEFAKAQVSGIGVLTWSCGADWDPVTLRALVMDSRRGH